MSNQEKQQLQKRIKKLEQEIIERTRNYMYQHSLTKSRRKDSVASRGSQTDSEYSKSKEPTVAQVPTPKKQSFNEFFNEIISPQKLCFEGSNENSPCKSLSERIQAGIDWLRKIQNKDELFEDMTKKIISLNEQNEIYRQNNKKLENMLVEVSKVEQKAEQGQHKIQVQEKFLQEDENRTIQIGSLQQELKRANERFHELGKVILETQQTNYRLRLTVQSLENELKAKQQLLREAQEKWKKREQELMGKIEQMEVIKKQYLKAYSKVKEEKEALEIHFAELKEGNPLISKIPLNSISEQEQQHIDDVIRSSTADNSLCVIKNFMERSLIESNRTSMQKWITVCIGKLDQLQNESEHKVSDIHQNYRNLLKIMADNFKNQMKVLQKQFENAMNKIFIQDVKDVEGNQKKETKFLFPANSIKRSSSVQCLNSSAPSEHCSPGTEKKDLINVKDFNCSEEIMESEELLEKQRNWEIIYKLSISQAKCIGLQQKYDVLVHKLAMQSLKESRIHHQFKQMMERLVNFHKAGHQAFQLRINFVEVCQKVFKILENLPTGHHGSIYFIPKDFEELNESLDVLFRFSENYDKINEDKIAESNRKLKIIRQLMEEIFYRNNVSLDQVDEVLRKSLTQQSHAVSEFMGQLIENMRRNRQVNAPMIGSVISFGQSSKNSGIN